ncbi:hypothetical protein RchiOBHm_Chr5g0034831 [Rosa chinensis]|uniref:Uncharacterized protein n=1 Tax=Rosa chinensis TaxID=74649 RepID=A0A2P6QB19_ROSCH|nr:hypothetical protein RchiOBHm_Chr5g0034831 [Rosa chinensis]
MQAVIPLLDFEENEVYRNTPIVFALVLILLFTHFSHPSLTKDASCSIKFHFSLAYTPSL